MAPSVAGRPANQVEFPGATWTSFDRYARYGAIARAVRACLGPGIFRVLDVGDGAGYLSEFDADLHPISVDLELAEEPLPTAVRLAGDGVQLPFPDASFEAVVSSDALEHVPPARRDPFLRELVRVSRDVVVVAAPFDTPGVGGAEELVRRFVLLATGSPQAQLVEHGDSGLPGVEATEKVLADCGLQVASAGNGNLHDWLTMMLIKHQITAREALGPLSSGYDILYNSLFAGREQVGPYYRHVIAGRRHTTPDLGCPAGLIEGTPVDISAVLAIGAATNVAEAVRQDTVPFLHRLGSGVDDIGRRVDALHQETDFLRKEMDDLRRAQDASGAHLAALVTTAQFLLEVVARLDELADRNDHRMGSLIGLARHPVRGLGQAVRRRLAR